MINDIFLIDLCIEYCCLNDFNLIVLALYHSPSGPFDIFLDSLEGLLGTLNPNKQVLVAGDFNVDFRVNNTCACKLQGVFGGFNLAKTINESTRGKNCLDNVFLDPEVPLDSVGSLMWGSRITGVRLSGLGFAKRLKASLRQLCL